MKEQRSELLLVEDNKRDADLTIRALKKREICKNVVWVKDGVEALDYLFGRGQYSARSIRNQPKVMLLDLKMPKVDGLKVLKEVRSREETKHLPVVILTSSSEEKDIFQSYANGVNSYIVKPVDFDHFLDTVSHVGSYWLKLNKA